MQERKWNHILLYGLVEISVYTLIIMYTLNITLTPNNNITMLGGRRKGKCVRSVCACHGSDEEIHQ